MQCFKVQLEIFFMGGMNFNYFETVETNLRWKSQRGVTYLIINNPLKISSVISCIYVWNIAPWPTMTQQVLQTAVWVMMICAKFKCFWRSGVTITMTVNLDTVHCFESFFFQTQCSGKQLIELRQLSLTGSSRNLSSFTPDKKKYSVYETLCLKKIKTMDNVEMFLLEACPSSAWTFGEEHIMSEIFRYL
jgi:hypothetical protein